MSVEQERGRAGRKPASGPLGTALILLRIRRLGVRVPLSAGARSVVRIVQGAVRAMRLASWFLAVWPQAFEHASQEWLAACQASCPVGVSLGCEPVESLFASCAVSRAVT